MNTTNRVNAFIEDQPETKRNDLKQLHQHIILEHPQTKLWFDNGRNEENKIVTNPTIGYGTQILKYANGTTKEWFRIGISANATGISVYILGIEDKDYLKQTYGSTIGKAKVTGYCIRFKALKDINADVLKAAIDFGLKL